MQIQIGILIAVSIIGYLLWEKISYTRNLKESRGKVWARFYNEIGNAHDVLCPVQGNILMAPGNVLEKLHSKPGMESADYIVTPDNTFTMAWPPGKPARVQVNVNHVCYYEGVSTPIITRSSDKRQNPGGAFTPEMVANIRNEKFTELTVKFIAGAADTLKKLESAMGLSPRVTQIAVVAMIALAGYGAWNSYQIMILMGRVIRALGA